LISDAVNPGSALALPDGAMSIGTRGGLTLYRPSEDQEDLSSWPANVISNVDVNGEWVDPTSAIALDHKDDSIAIRYSALNFVDAHAIQFRYRIKGVSNEWKETADHLVRIVSLKPGALYVRKCNRGSRAASTPRLRRRSTSTLPSRGGR